MYRNLPKNLFKHKHTKGWSIPGYSTDGVLFFTSKEKASQYTYTDAPLFNESEVSNNSDAEDFPLENLKPLLESLIAEGPHFEQYKAVVFNLTNEGKYDAVYDVAELYKLLKEDIYYSADSSYTSEYFENLLNIYNYQRELTEKLDGYKGDMNFSEGIINKIVLWKVNRYVSTNSNNDWLPVLNTFKDDTTIEEDKLRNFLTIVLNQVRGVDIAMASTFLRFRNPDVYQIIDERTFRVVMRNGNSRKKLKDYKNFDEKIDLYIDYLKKLRTVCESLQIKYQNSDRILYQFDKIKNGNFNGIK